MKSANKLLSLSVVAAALIGASAYAQKPEVSQQTMPGGALAEQSQTVRSPVQDKSIAPNQQGTVMTAPAAATAGPAPASAPVPGKTLPPAVQGMTDKPAIAPEGNKAVK